MEQEGGWPMEKIRIMACVHRKKIFKEMERRKMPNAMMEEYGQNPAIQEVSK